MANRMGDLAREDDYLLPPPWTPWTGFNEGIARGLQSSPWLAGSKPAAPGQLSEEDQFRANQMRQNITDLGVEGGFKEVINPSWVLTAMARGLPLRSVTSMGAGAGQGRMGELARAPEVETGATATVTQKPSTISSIKKYVSDPQRVGYPGIYKRPDVIAREAAANVAPEHPAMKELFGVTRDDLYGISQGGTRQGNMEPVIASVANPKGSYAAEAIMRPRNAQRMVDTLAEAEKYPQLTRGMDAWYVMDPVFQRMVQLGGREQAIKDYQRFNTVVPMFSPGSEVLTEINRGTAANMMINRGQWPLFDRFGGTAVGSRGADFPEALRDVTGHPYHSTAQAGPVGRYLESGVVDMTQPKVPLYMQASGVPETGFQTKLPVPDAHFTRAVGMSDVRKNANPGASMKTPEYAAFGPWYRENVAKPLGIEAVPAQARMWGTYAPQTGVDTAVGAPKLELLSQAIWDRARKLGVDPKMLRDQVLQGQEHAVWPFIAGGAVMGGVAAQDRYE